MSVQDPFEETAADLTIVEVLILVIKTCLNKPKPEMTLAQLSQFIRVFLQACEVQFLQSMPFQCESLSEVLETLAAFCVNINLKGVNQRLFNSIHRGDSSEAESHSEADTHSGSHESVSSMKALLTNLRGAPFFEEAIAQLISLEVGYLGR